MPSTQPYSVLTSARDVRSAACTCVGSQCSKNWAARCDVVHTITITFPRVGGLNYIGMGPAPLVPAPSTQVSPGKPLSTFSQRPCPEHVGDQAAQRRSVFIPHPIGAQLHGRLHSQPARAGSSMQNPYGCRGQYALPFPGRGNSILKHFARVSLPQPGWIKSHTLQHTHLHG